jgi:NAD(P)H-dependent FMN reductase
MTTPLRLAVVVGSTRPGRQGRVIADWFVARAARRPDLDVDLIDLLAVDLPAHLPDGPDPRVVAYTRRIDAADAFVVVTPEYNHGYPAPLKQAIDLAHHEWFAKPVGFVGYGGMAGGMRAVEQLRQVFAELHAVTVRDTVGFHGLRGFDAELGPLDVGGWPVDPEGAAGAAATMLEQLVWWADALRAARAARPYAA